MELDLGATRWDFGLLPHAISASANGWRIETLETARQRSKEWSALGDWNGWVYPPIATSEAEDGSELVHLRRSSLLWYLPATHSLILEGGRPGAAGEAVFLIYALGVFFGIQLQNDEWLVTGRVQSRPSTLFKPNPARPSEATERAIRAFSTWFRDRGSELQMSMTSACYLHNLVPSYEWDWELFGWQYAVLEAVYRAGVTAGDVQDWKQKQGQQKSLSYPQQCELLATKYGLAVEASWFGTWSRLRHPLVHQALWAGTVPGHAPRSLEPEAADRAWYSLRNFTTAAILAVLGYKSPRLNHPWWDFAPVFI